MSEPVSPFGGESLPIKELKKEKLPKLKNLQEEKPPNKASKLVVMLAAVVGFLVVVVSLLLGLVVVKKPQPLQPSPSPVIIISSPVATSEAVPRSVGERLNQLEINLEEVDLRQTEFSFPILDFQFNVEKTN